MKRSRFAIHRTIAWALLVVAGVGGYERASDAGQPASSSGSSDRVMITERDDRLCVSIDGEPFAEYRFQGFSRPIVYPIFGPHGLAMTRNYPMKDVPGESRDHIHQKAMFLGHGSVNGVNFFGEAAGSGKTVHRELLAVESGSERGLIRTATDWVAADGRVVCSDIRTLGFQAVPGGRVIDWEVTLHASHGEVKFADDKHGLLAIRMHPNLRLDNAPKSGVTTANGQAMNSEGVKGKAVFGKRARWIDYWGKIDEKTVGIALFDHPTNPRHPTWWMARGYGYVAADPFGAHTIGGEPPGTADMLIPAGEFVTFRYRFLFHEGDPEQADVAARYARYVKECQVTNPPQ